MTADPEVVGRSWRPWRDDPVAWRASVWQSIFDSDLDAIVITTDDGSRCLAVNRRMCDLLGRTEEEILAGTPFSMIEMTPDLVVALDRRAESGTAQLQVIVVRGDGVRVPVWLRSIRCRLPDGEWYNVSFANELPGVGAPEVSAYRWQADLQTLVDAARDLVFSVEPHEFRLQWFNQSTLDAARSVEGVTVRPGGRPDEMFDDPDEAAWWTEAYRHCLASGTHVVQHLLGDTLFEIKFQTVSELSTDVTAIVVDARDVTSETRALADLASSEAKYRSVVEAMAEGVVVQAADGSIVETNPAALRIEGRSDDEMLGKTSEDDSWESIREDGSPFPGEEHPAMVTLRTGQPQHDVIMGIRRPDGQRRWISINSAPIGAGERIGSVVSTFHDITARKAAEHQLEASVRSLEQLVEGTLRALATAVELRDAYTHGHMAKVAAISEAIAIEMGLPDERRRLLKLAASVHDVGKIAVPFEILNTPAQLGPIELRLVREHAENSYRILREISEDTPIAEIVRQHHERLDGSGYPCGLRGDEISLEARILAVADVVESMATHRPYRPALGLDAAQREIEAGRGTRYDADAADALVRLLTAGYEIPELPTRP